MLSPLIQSWQTPKSGIAIKYRATPVTTAQISIVNPELRYPNISDLERKAQKRMSHVAWEYLASGTGAEEALERNTEAFRNITLTPRLVTGNEQPDTRVTLFGQQLDIPFGVAPVGLSSLMWPKAEAILARAAVKAGSIYGLSTVAGASIEDIGKITGERGWFQLYTPRDKAMRHDILKRAQESGYSALLVTVDVPTGSRRERQRRAGVAMPPAITPRLIYDLITHPAWSLATAKNGAPRFRTLEQYASAEDLSDVTSFVGRELNRPTTLDDLADIREHWDGPLLVKGVMTEADIELSLQAGAEGVVVSNHGGRQLDIAPAAIDVLPKLAQICKGRATVVYDSGIRSGADIVRALALGADYVMLGRAFLFGVGALGQAGGDHTFKMLREEVINVMIQLGCDRVADLPDFLA